MKQIIWAIILAFSLFFTTKGHGQCCPTCPQSLTLMIDKTTSMAGNHPIWLPMLQSWLQTNAATDLSVRVIYYGHSVIVDTFGFTSISQIDFSGLDDAPLIELNPVFPEGSFQVMQHAASDTMMDSFCVNHFLLVTDSYGHTPALRNQVIGLMRDKNIVPHFLVNADTWVMTQYCSQDYQPMIDSLGVGTYETGSDLQTMLHSIVLHNLCTDFVVTGSCGSPHYVFQAVADSSIFSYRWDFNSDGVIDVITTHDSVIVNLSSYFDSTLHVTLTIERDHCFESITKDVYVYGNVDASFAVEMLTGCYDTVVAHGSSNPLYHHIWGKNYYPWSSSYFSNDSVVTLPQENPTVFVLEHIVYTSTCVDTFLDSVFVTHPGAQLYPVFFPHNTCSNPIQFYFEIIEADTGVFDRWEIAWGDSSPDTVGYDMMAPLIHHYAPGFYTLRVTLYDQNGCSVQEDYLVNYYDFGPYLSIDTLCDSDQIQLVFSDSVDLLLLRLNGMTIPAPLPNDTLLLDATISNVVEYTVLQDTGQYNCMDIDSLVFDTDICPTVISSLEETASMEEFRAYPNPIGRGEQLQLSIAPESVRLFAVNGVEIPVLFDEITVGIPYDIPMGMYMLQVIFNGESYTQKLIIQ